MTAYPKHLTGTVYKTRETVVNAMQLAYDGSNLAEVIQFVGPTALETITFDQTTGAPTVYIRNATVEVRPTEWIVQEAGFRFNVFPAELFEETYIKVNK